MLDTQEEATQCYAIIQACLSCYFILAEVVFGESVEDFPFTYKGHMATAHIVQQCFATGHPSNNNDLYVERSIRSDACKSCR